MSNTTFFPRVLLLLVLASCGGKEPGPTGDSNTDADTDTDSDADSDSDSDADTDSDTDTDTTEDADGDGFSTAEGDCDDSVPAVFPGAPDLVGDGVDQNCDGADGIDVDGDGHADLASGGGDCDDGEPLINPIASDVVGDSIDQNCDGVDGIDADQDGFAGASSGGTDCDDVAPETFLGAPEACDGADNDCDAEVDNKDDDADGFVDESCTAYTGILPITDCDDANASVVPNGLETNGNGVDDNCNGLTDAFVLTMTWANVGTPQVTFDWNVADLPFDQGYLGDAISVGIDNGFEHILLGCELDGTTDCGNTVDYSDFIAESVVIFDVADLSYRLQVDTTCWVWGADLNAWDWLQTGCGSVVDNGSTVIPQ